MYFIFVFFKQKTAYEMRISDWSSDVCSSDLPILSGLIAGAGTRIGTRRALWLSFIYVLASALVFTVAGVVAGLVGANLQVAFQVPWVIALFALLFVALALSSFGLDRKSVV